MNRTLIFSTLILLTVPFTSCKKKGCTDKNATNYSTEAEKDDGSCQYEETTWFSYTTVGTIDYRELADTINEDITLTSGGLGWLITSAVHITDGNTITIEAGTTIYADNQGEVPYLVIDQGATITACGTATEPIVFTSLKSSPAAGDWGGLIIHGNAGVAGGTDSDATGSWGGMSDGDNSGSLCYVRVEYAGATVGSDNLPAFGFYGCGSSTSADHLQAYKCGSDGFKIRGGTISMKHLIASGSGADSFDWSDGWTGNGQFWVAEQYSMDGDKGIEGENGPVASVTGPSPKISNVTLIGSDDGDGNNQGILFTNETQGQVVNAIVTGFPLRGVEAKGDSTISNMTLGNLVFQNSIIDNTFPFKFTSSAGNDTTTTLMLNDVSYMNQLSTSGALVSFMDGFKGVSSTDPFDPTTFGIWFSAASYIGAVDPTNDWTSGWTLAL